MSVTNNHGYVQLVVKFNARWIKSAWEKLKVQTNVIKTGWYRSGMLYEKSV
jgi:hypothetical protein